MTVRLQSRQLSQLHLYQVLHAVRVRRGAMSRAEIAERTGLSQPAVSSLTRRLLASGALIEGDARPSQGGGRRERELMLNSAFAWVVGVKIAMHQLTITLVDFAGGVATTIKRPLAAPLRLPELVRQVAREIDKALAGAGGPVRERLADGDTRWINRGAYDLLGSNPEAARSSAGLPRATALYGSLPQQLRKPDSFASQLTSSPCTHFSASSVAALVSSLT